MEKIKDIKKNNLINQLDKLNAKLDINEKYLEVFEEILSEKYDRKIQSKQVKIKKRLYRLEQKSLPNYELNKIKQDEKIERFNDSNKLRIRAIREEYYRNYMKKGEIPAKAYKSKKLAQIDHKLSLLKTKLDKKYPLDIKNQSTLENDKRVFEETTIKGEIELKNFKNKIISHKFKKVEQIKSNIINQNKIIKNKINSLRLKLEPYILNDENLKLNENSILKIDELLMQFGGLKAVDNLSFEVKKGEIFGLIGPNGAGKTTVFNCITQFYKPTAGYVIYRDKNGSIIDLKQKKVHDVVKTGIVRTFQNVELIWELSVLDNMLVASHTLYHSSLIDQLLHSSKLKREEQVIRTKALKVLERLDLIEYKDSIPFGLPYGILKKIELARTLMVNPQLIILDEPAAGLNDKETEELTQVIKQIQKDFECTIFLVEHDMGLVMELCDTICAISFGKMLAIGTPSTIQENKQVQEAYLGGE